MHIVGLKKRRQVTGKWDRLNSVRGHISSVNHITANGKTFLRTQLYRVATEKIITTARYAIDNSKDAEVMSQIKDPNAASEHLD